MMPRQLRMLAVLSAFGLAATVAAADEAPYRVVVHESRKISSLKPSQVADYLLKHTSTWPDGTPVEVVDLSSKSPARAALSKQILGRSIDAVVHYWQQQMYSGRGTPPPVKSEEEVLAFVASTPGAIGYVGVDSALPTGVRALQLTK
jgi:ABC-type phosphate transport system substrate-binding protein